MTSVSGFLWWHHKMVELNLGTQLSNIMTSPNGWADITKWLSWAWLLSSTILWCQRVDLVTSVLRSWLQYIDKKPLKMSIIWLDKWFKTNDLIKFVVKSFMSTTKWWRANDFSHRNWRKYIISVVIWILSPLKSLKFNKPLFLKDRINIFEKNLFILVFMFEYLKFSFLLPNTNKIWCQPDLVDNLAFCLSTVVRPQNRPIRKKNVLRTDLSDKALQGLQSYAFCVPKVILGVFLLYILCPENWEILRLLYFLIGQKIFMFVHCNMSGNKWVGRSGFYFIFFNQSKSDAHFDWT